MVSDSLALKVLVEMFLNNSSVGPHIQLHFSVLGGKKEGDEFFARAQSEILLYACQMVQC